MLYRLHRPCGVWHGRRAAAMVEFAFVAPIFFLIVLGVIEFARGLMVMRLLTNAARDGARAAIIGNTTTSNIQTLVTNELGTYGLKTSNVTVNVEVNDATSPGLTTSTASGTEITVQVTIPVADTSWLPKLSWLSGNLAGQFTMRME